MFFSLKRVVAAWRVLVGVWAPKHWDLSLTALTQYTVPKVPPANIWIDKPRSGSTTPRAVSPAKPSETDAPTSKPRKARRPPSRRLVRHVLRARIEAAKALVALFAYLERSDVRVRASAHLALAHGGFVDGDASRSASVASASEGVGEVEEPRGWRNAKEVITYLRERGAKVGQLKDRVAGEWAAVSSDGEGEGTDLDSGAEDLVWVPSSSSLDLAL